MKKISALVALLFLANTMVLSAGKTFRNSLEEPHARKNALSKTWAATGSKKETNRKLQSMQNTKLSKKAVTVATTVVKAQASK